jgi:hypothetical protein
MGVKNGGQVFYAYTISVNVDEEIGRSGIWGRLRRLRAADYRDGGRRGHRTRGTSIDRLPGIHHYPGGYQAPGKRVVNRGILKPLF